MKNHLKARAAPRTWNVPRKAQKYLPRPNPGSQSLAMTLPLGLFLRNIAIGSTNKEINYIIKHSPVLVNGARRWDYNYGVGFMDVIALPDNKQYYILSMDSKGRLAAESIDEKQAASKLSQARTMSKIKTNKLQLHLSDGRNILVKERIAPGSTVVVSVPEGNILKTFLVEEAASVILTSGKHRGKRGTIATIKEDMITVQTPTEVISTKKSYAFVLGGKA